MYIKKQGFFRLGERQKRPRSLLGRMTIKPLLPSLREKKRYLAFQVQGDGTFTASGAQRALLTELHNYIGSLGLAGAGPVFLKDWKDNIGIVRIQTRYVDHLKAALALVREVDAQEAKIESLRVSGLLSHVREVYA